MADQYLDQFYRGTGSSRMTGLYLEKIPNTTLGFNKKSLIKPFKENNTYVIANCWFYHINHVSESNKIY